MIAKSIGAVLVVGVAGYLVWHFTRPGAAAAAGAAVGKAVVDAGTGAILGIGDGLGVPRTDKSKCQQAIDSGDLFGVSLYCQGIGTGNDTFSTQFVYAVGDALGIPRTNETECQKALREGRMWDASFKCPAGDFLGALFK